MKSLASVVLRAARPHDVERVAHDRLGHRHLAHQPLERNQILAGDRAFELRILDRRRRPDHAELLVVRRVVDDDVEHEAIELRFRQRVRAFELDRVLRGEHVERLVELIGLALHGDAMLLHRFEQRRLRLRRGAVDFVRQHDVGEDRPRREHHLPATGSRILLHEIRAGDVGRHQVGRELDARELQRQHARHRMNQQCLCQTWRTHDQAVPTDEQRHQHLADDFVLADDDLLQLGDNLPPARVHPIGERDVIRRVEVDDVTDHWVHSSSMNHFLAASSAARISRVLRAMSVASVSSSRV